MQYLDTKALAGRTGLSASYWNQTRLRGDGPEFLKIGRRVLYRWADVEAWLAERRRQSTSERPA